MSEKAPFKHERKLSKKAALIITRELWKWVEENSATSKAGWPYWSRLERIYGEFETYSHCACCKYTSQESKKLYVCPLCPLLGYAWCYGDPYMVPCQSSQSPYRTWFDSVNKLEKRPNDELALATLRGAAGRIVAGCIKALQVLETETTERK
jgi:hypothetical protein